MAKNSIDYSEIFPGRFPHIVEKILIYVEPQDVLNCCHATESLKDFVTEKSKPISEWIETYLKMWYLSDKVKQFERKEHYHYINSICMHIIKVKIDKIDKMVEWVDYQNYHHKKCKNAEKKIVKYCTDLQKCKELYASVMKKLEIKLIS